jgi:hypothetical protein
MTVIIHLKSNYYIFNMPFIFHKKQTYKTNCCILKTTFTFDKKHAYKTKCYILNKNVIEKAILTNYNTLNMTIIFHKNIHLKPNYYKINMTFTFRTTVLS